MKSLIVANWKMELTLVQARSLARRIRSASRRVHGSLVLCPSFTAIADVVGVLRGSGIAVGGQNIGALERGQLTGEVSARDLAALGARYVILGHSDRRRLGETDALIAQKVPLALRFHLTPVVCIGETLQERRRGTTDHVLRRQLRAVLGNLRRAQRTAVIVAYEPVWAISPGGPIAPAQAFSAARVIRRWLASATTRILYGGSVSPRNVRQFVDGQHFSGALVGKASLQPRTLLSLF